MGVEVITEPDIIKSQNILYPRISPLGDYLYFAGGLIWNEDLLEGAQFKTFFRQLIMFYLKVFYK